MVHIKPSDVSVVNIIFVAHAAAISPKGKIAPQTQDPMKSRKPRAAYHHGDLQNTLVERALAHLSRAGLEELSLRGLAAEIGVSPSAAYRHFEHRESLLAELARRGFARLVDNMEREAATAADAGERLSAVAGCYVRFALDNPQLYRLMFGAQRVEKSRYPELQAESQRAFGVVSRVVGSLPLSPPPSDEVRYAITMGCWALVHGLASLRIDALTVDMSEEAFGKLVRTALDELLPKRLVAARASPRTEP